MINIDLFGQEVKELEVTTKGNPLIRTYGPGPIGKTCKNCIHLYRKQMSKSYLKCDLRPDTNGPGTDHRAKWQSCGKYEEEGT